MYNQLDDLLVTEKFKQKLESQLEISYPSPDAQVIKTTSRRPTKPALQSPQKIELDAQNGRTQILETDIWPNSVHGAVASKFQNIINWGTGILIGPNIVLTAGQNLYDLQDKTHASLEDLQFLLGMNDNIALFGAIQVENYFVSPNYIQEGKEDYGILVLKEPVGEKTGYFGLACLEPEEIQTKRINVTGYPGDIDPAEGLINCHIDTRPGQSGIPWYQEGEDYYVCGVNKETLFTRAIYKQIYTWLQQVSFLLRLKNTKTLQFWGYQINSQCISLLMKYTLDDLRALDLCRTKMGDEEARLLAQNTSWTNLSYLDLSENHIGEEGAKALAENASWVKLSELNLSKNNVGTDGAIALAQNISWVNLSKLQLVHNDVGFEGEIALIKNETWKKDIKIVTKMQEN